MIQFAHFLGLARQSKPAQREAAPEPAPAPAIPELTGWAAERARRDAMATEPQAVETEPDDTDDDAAEMIGTGPLAAARQRERARCAAIFAHPAAASNIPLAASLAFGTTLTRAEVVAFLDGAGRSAW